MDRGDLDLAERDLEAALRLNPSDALALGNRGLLRIRQGQTALGQADLARCVELRKDLQPMVQRIVGRNQQPQAAAESRRPCPFAAAEMPAVRPCPFATPTVPAGRPYAAATPAEAVQWLAAAGKSEDVDATIEALAAPLGDAFGKLRAAAAQMDVAMGKYRAAKNARSGDFFNLANSSLAQLIQREQRKQAAAQKFVVQEMQILSQEPVGNEKDAAMRLVVRTIKRNALGETQTPKEIYYAVREGGGWKLLPESAWRALNDAGAARFLMSYFSQQVDRLQAMCAITEKATQAMADGNPVSEIELLAAWNTVSQGVPWPGKMGDETPSLAEAFLKALNAMIWEQAAQPPFMAQPGQGLFQPQQPQPSAGDADPDDARPSIKPRAKRPPQSSPARPSPWGPVE